MAVKKKLRNGNGSIAVMKRPSSCAAVIRRVLCTTPEIDAVYLLRDDANVVHVFSVVREFESKIYEKLLKRERAIERNLSQVSFEFHVRAHQGREPAQAVPFKAELVYAQ